MALGDWAAARADVELAGELDPGEARGEAERLARLARARGRADREFWAGVFR